MTPNNCKTCGHLHHKDGGHRYMYRGRPAPAVLMGGTLVIGALVFNELLGWKEQP